MAKIPVAPRTRAEMMSEFPIESSVDGWFFRSSEVSNNYYVVEGCDLWGRRVKREGSDPDQALAQCEADAKTISEQVRRAL